MPVFSNIVINDGQATPVAHTFSPSNLSTPNNGLETVAAFDEVNTAISPLGWTRVTVSFKRPPPAMAAGRGSTADRVYKASYLVEMPVLESTSAATGTGIPPVPTVSHVLRAKCDMWAPEKASQSERNNLIAFIKNLIGHSVPAGVFTGLQAYY